MMSIGAPRQGAFSCLFHSLGPLPSVAQALSCPRRSAGQSLLSSSRDSPPPTLPHPSPEGLRGLSHPEVIQAHLPSPHPELTTAAQSLGRHGQSHLRGFWGSGGDGGVAAGAVCGLPHIL